MAVLLCHEEITQFIRVWCSSFLHWLVGMGGSQTEVSVLFESTHELGPMCKVSSYPYMLLCSAVAVWPVLSRVFFIKDNRYSSCSSCSSCWDNALIISARLHRFRLDRDEIWQNWSLSKYASIDGVGYLIWHHTFMMATITHSYLFVYLLQVNRLFRALVNC